jgi:ribosomal protein S18 acetylase RimI-like enzyme
MANVVSDLLAPGVWHIGLFMIASTLQGSGAAQALYEELEHWARGLGAQWLRLGVVEGNARAERFWESRAFVEVRKRDGVEMGAKINTLRVMAKPLAGGTPAEYFALVARDRPGEC